MPIADSQGTTFIFNSVTFTATNIQQSFTGLTQIDVSDHSIASGGSRAFQASPLNDSAGSEISVDFLGLEAPDMSAAHAITCATLSISGNAICKSYNVTAAVGEVLKGSATFSMVD
jgi:hypothetical protein